MPDDKVQVVDEGQGQVILVVHPGLDDGASWGKVAARLTARFRVVRIHRRQYRLDLADRLPCSIADEAAEVAALAQSFDEPVLLVGHSSGAVVALEALVRSTASFSGAVLYEPPVHLRVGEWTAAVAHAQAEIAAGRPGTAMKIFTRDIVALPGWIAGLIAMFVAFSPRFRALAPHQVDDAAAIENLGVRLDAYAGIAVPIVLLGGDRSPAHLIQRLKALQSVIPAAELVTMPGQGHDANTRAPETVAGVVEGQADKVWTR
ncbi:pimeloyl-ACP methyl ester carboxylesterase [Hamadaea flava]|uniref:Alpha/beta fold hydrolase n=1 Tax=Hamadaea flava TaxID=1742688 RepID=A0ABV8LWB4_9ACTN|nr:alpha/beta hydrolase [Hamadaea flava]MCP2324735.1 pimeloyl-ACP methyl ester carboxylesterase [Hamadaea flava]